MGSPDNDVELTYHMFTNTVFLIRKIYSTTVKLMGVGMSFEDTVTHLNVKLR